MNDMRKCVWEIGKSQGKKSSKPWPSIKINEYTMNMYFIFSSKVHYFSIGVKAVICKW